MQLTDLIKYVTDLDQVRCQLVDGFPQEGLGGTPTRLAAFPKGAILGLYYFLFRSKESASKAIERTFASRCLCCCCLGFYLSLAWAHAQAGIGSYDCWKKAEEQQHRSQLLSVAAQKLSNTYRNVTAKWFSKREKKNPMSHWISLSF